MIKYQNNYQRKCIFTIYKKYNLTVKENENKKKNNGSTSFRKIVRIKFH